MTSLDRLLRTIYHEKQESGSMLCAQHALNSLFQANYFTAPALSDIAKSLDAMESSYDESHSESTNMDDTGFFSVQVIQQALSFWGLDLARWRGEDMRPYQDRPHTQLAFILNLEQHWYTLRRFGHAEPNIDDDEGNGHWFNLDSLQPAPKWVGRTYLGMTIQQAEADGYSVFAVTQTDPNAPLALSRTDADDLAAVLSEDEIVASQRVASQNATRDPAASSSSSSRFPAGFEGVEGLEDEDFELQAALHMSMGGTQLSDFSALPSAPPPLRRATAPLPAAQDPGVRGPTRAPSAPQPPVLPQEEEDDVDMEEDADPIAASMVRNRQLLQRMQAQQEHMHRELYQGFGDDDEAAARRAERQRQEQEAEAELQRVIEESRRMAEEHQQQSVQKPQPQADAMDFADVEDEELRAALRASMEHVPEGWTMPEQTHAQRQAAPSAAIPGSTSTAPQVSRSDSVHTERTESPDPTISEASQDDIPVEEVSIEELRRRRLARFG